MVQIFKKYYSLFQKDIFFKTTSFLFILNVTSSAANYIYQIYANRNLSQENYGLLNALFSLSIVVSIFSDVLRQWITKCFTEVYSQKAHRSVIEVFKYFFVLIVLVLAVVIGILYLTSFYFPKFFGADTPAHLWLFLAMVVITYLSILPGSFLDSYQHFVGHAMAGFLGTLAKILLLFSFILWSFGITQALLTQVLGSLIMFLILVGLALYNYLKLVRDTKDPVGKIEFSKNPIYFIKIGMASIFLILASNADVMLARLAMPASLSGMYATASTFGKTVFYLSVVAMPLFYVSVSDHFNRQVSFQKLFFKGLFSVSAIALAGMLGLVIFIKPFAQFLNPAYSLMIPEILFFALSVFPYIFIQFFSTFFISINSYKIFVVALLLLVLQSTLLVLLGHEVHSFILLRLISGAFILLVFVAYYFFEQARRKVSV